MQNTQQEQHIRLCRECRVNPMPPEGAELFPFCSKECHTIYADREYGPKAMPHKRPTIEELKKKALEAAKREHLRNKKTLFD